MVSGNIDHSYHCEMFYWTTGLSTGDSDIGGKVKEESQTSSDQNNVQYTCAALHVIHDSATSNVKQYRRCLGAKEHMAGDPLVG